jgi:molybdenum-dependent DNA-binding transcriptional regulator ModE
MNGRNGKPIIMDDQINKVKELVKTTSIRQAASSAGMAYSTAWEIKNGLYKPDNRMMIPKEKKQSQFFEHDKSWY